MAKQAAVQKNQAEQEYDAVPYQSFAYAQTHPTHIATIARLFGLKTPDIKTARVLELGCASGGNLAPIAYTYPESKCHGIDISGQQIEQAQERKKFLGLKNVEFVQQNILDFKAKSKKDQYDYIICHGIYSWVPEEVRERILEICEEVLSPNGVAVISYNALPGWNAVRSLREMMLYHTNRFSNPADKVAQARLLLDFVSESVPQANAGYREVIEKEREMLRNINNSYLYHDHLESDNEQFYLSDFVAKAQEKGLNYVGDASLTSMFLGNMPATAIEKLQALNDVVAQEQYMDFITNRRFRSTILCKKGKELNRNLDINQILDFYLTFNSQLEVKGTDPNKDIVFKVGAGEFTTHDPVAGALFLELASVGRKPISAQDLIERTKAKLGAESEEKIKAVLLQNGMRLVLKGFVFLHADTVNYVTEVSDKPEVTPLARYDASLPYTKIVTNALSQSVNTDATAKALIHHLDGTKGRSELIAVLQQAMDQGVITMQQDGNPVTDKAVIEKNLELVLDGILKKLADGALLIA